MNIAFRQRRCDSWVIMALRETPSYMLWRRNSARVAQCVTIGVVPPVVRISGTVIVKRVRGKMDKFVVVQRKRKRSSSRERDFCKRDRNDTSSFSSLPVEYSVVTMILVTSLEFPWLMLIDERYCLIAGPLLQVSRFHMQQLVLKIKVSRSNG